MTIDEEIETLENALKGALLVPSECAFVSTEIIKICLETLKTYESLENLIKWETDKHVRADERAKTVDALLKAIEDNSYKEAEDYLYGTNARIVIWEVDLRTIAEQLKTEDGGKE